MPVDKPLRADARRTRDALLATAREVFDAGEFFDLRFDDFARLAGVGTGTLYRHFPTRQALAEAVYHGEVETLCARARHLRATLPAAEALADFLCGMVEHIQAHQGLARTLATLMAGGSISPGVGSSRALEQVVSDLVTDAAREGTVRDDVDAGAVMVALHGISAAHDRPGWRAEADGLITLLLDGLRRPLPVRTPVAPPTVG